LSDLIIKIGDNDIDLKVDETIAITKQAAKVGDFSTVLADGTNEVKIPLTPRNKTILDNAHLVETDSNKPYGRIGATMIQEGYQTIQDGYAIVKSSSNDFSLQLIGGNASFFDLIKDLELRSLDLSDYDHFWTNQNVFDNRNNTDGLIYAVFEQGLSDNTMTTYGTNLYAVETDLLLPSFYRKTLVELIFAQQGYTFVTDLSSEDIYDKAIEFRAEIPDRGNDMTYHECTVTSTFLDVANTFLFDTASVSGTSEYSGSAELLAGVQDPSNPRFILTDSCTVTIDVHLIVFFTQLVPYTNTLRVEVLATNADGGSLTTTETINFDVEVVGSPNQEFDFTLTFDASELPSGEVYFKVKPVCASDFGFFFTSGTYYTVRNVELIKNSVITTNFPNNYITGAVPVPDMKQGEYLKECAKMYQWIFDVNERTRTVTAKRFDQVKDSIPEAIDLSDKLHANDIKINYGINGFAQTNALRYKEDDITKYDAVGYIDVSDTTLKPENDYVKMEHFAATSTRTRFDTVNAPYVPIFDEDLLPTNGLTDRVFLVRRETFPYNINFNRDSEVPPNIPTSDVTFAYFAEAGNNDSLDFPTLITRFYQTIIDMNDKGKTIDCKMNLNIKDVMNYDPMKPVYIEHFGNYFYWEKLSNYVKDKLTKVKLIKI
jgi:hypothetical protein